MAKHVAELAVVDHTKLVHSEEASSNTEKTCCDITRDRNCLKRLPLRHPASPIKQGYIHPDLRETDGALEWREVLSIF